MSTPLVSNGDLFGVLTLYAGEPNAFTENHRRIVEVVASQVVQPLKLSLDSKLSKPAALGIEKRLPGVAQLETAVAAELAESGINSRVSVVFIHLEISTAGKSGQKRPQEDDTAALVALAIVNPLRRGDSLFTYGNNEFVLLLADTDAQAATAMAERIGRIVSAVAAPLPGLHDSRIQVTLSTATAPVDGVTFPDLARAALGRRINGPFTMRSAPPAVH